MADKDPLQVKSKHDKHPEINQNVSHDKERAELSMIPLADISKNKEGMSVRVRSSSSVSGNEEVEEQFRSSSSSYASQNQLSPEEKKQQEVESVLKNLKDMRGHSNHNIQNLKEHRQIYQDSK